MGNLGRSVCVYSYIYMTHEASIAKLEEDISSCEAEIRRAAQQAEMAMDAGSERQFEYWAKEKEQLRKKEEQLRKEKEQLRNLTIQESEPPQSVRYCLTLQICNSKS